MNTESLFIFLILLFGLLLCALLGGREGFTSSSDSLSNGNTNANHANHANSGTQESQGAGSSTGYSGQYDNYNHYTGSSTSQLTAGSVYYGQNGTTATVVSNSDGTFSLQIILPGSSSPVMFTTDASNASTSSTSNTTTTSTGGTEGFRMFARESYTNYYGPNGTVTTYYGPNGATATVVNGDNGQLAIKVTSGNTTYYYNASGTNAAATNINTVGPNTVGPNTVGSVSSVTGPAGNTAYYATTTPPPYNGPNPVANPYVNPVANPYVNPVANPYVNPATNPYVNPVTNPYVNPATNPNNPNPYDSVLPPGIPKSQIPPGQEDLYILKSEVIPPVCPACPVASTFPRQDPPPPCPACARCPEPAFDCKKVPNYSAMNSDTLPMPVISDFSQFGM